MKTYPIFKEDGSIFAFEIDNTYVPKRYIRKYLETKEGISQMRSKGLESSDHRLEFEFRGASYVMSEDYGDSSCYWIGPKNLEKSLPQTAELEKLFKELKESVLRKLFFYLMWTIVAIQMIRLLVEKFS